MTLIDSHTHRLNHSSDTLAIYQLLVENYSASLNQIPSNTPFACGIHPKDADQDQLTPLFEQLSKNPHCVAIGETGFDKLVAPSIEQQSSCFEIQLSTAINNHKPLIIHCVRSYDILYQHLNNNRKSTEIPIILHGFRGKPELAKQLLSKNIYLSFGPLYNVQSLRVTPLEKLLIETDDSGVDIVEVYQKIAHDLSITITELSAIVESNIRKIFGKTIYPFWEK